MPKYGNKKYHSLFARSFEKFMLKKEFSKESRAGATIFSRCIDNCFIDFATGYPTGSGPATNGKYPIWIVDGSYYRKDLRVENENEERIPRSYTNGFFATLFPRAARSPRYEQSNESVKILLKLWKEQMYDQIQADLLIFEDIQNLNILFNYPEFAQERGYLDIMSFDNTGPRGIVRSLIIAREAGDPNYESLLSAHIESYQQMKVEYPHEADVIDTIIKIISAVNVSKPT